MPRGSFRWNIIHILKVESLIKQRIETSIPISVLIIEQWVKTHLVNNYPTTNLGLFESWP